MFVQYFTAIHTTDILISTKTLQPTWGVHGKNQGITKQNQNQWEQLLSTQNSMPVNPIIYGDVAA